MSADNCEQTPFLVGGKSNSQPIILCSIPTMSDDAVDVHMPKGSNVKVRNQARIAACLT